MDIYKILKEKTTEFLISTILLGGLLFSIITTYDNKNELKEEVKTNKDIKEEILRNRQVLIGLIETSGNEKLYEKLAQGNLSFSGSDRTVGEERQNPKRYPYLEEESYQIALDQKRKQLKYIEQQTELLVSEFDRILLEFSLLQSRKIALFENYERISFQERMVDLELKELKERIGFLNTRTILLNSIARQTLLINKTLENGIKNINDASNTLRECILILQKKRFSEPAGQEFSVVVQMPQLEPGQLISKLVHIPRLEASALPRSDWQIGEAPSEFGDEAVIVRTSDLVGIVEAKITIVKKFNVELIKWINLYKSKIVSIDEFNKEKERAIEVLNQKLDESETARAQLRRDLEAVRESYIGARAKYDSATTKHSGLLATYKNGFDVNLDLLGEYLELASQVKDQLITGEQEAKDSGK